MTLDTPSSPAAALSQSEAAGLTSSVRETDQLERPRRVRWTAEQKSELLARFAASGLTAAEFCRRHHLSPATFSCWSRRFATGGNSPSSTAFAQVQLATAPAVAPEDAPVVVRIGGAISIDVHSGADPLWLGRLLQHLRGA